MNTSTRIILILMLMLPIAGAFAQEETTTTTAETSTAAETTTATAAEPARSGQQTREQFTRVLGQHPREVARILTLDPALLSNDPFLARYPDLADFIAKHPEVRRNPHYYLSQVEIYGEQRARTPFEDVVEALSIAGVFLLIAFALAWLVRTIIEQKRWNRLSKTQAEVHNKILDRFGTTSELMEYVKTPAGTKFLESAPIPLHEQKVTPNAPLARVMWSIQIGVIVAVGSLGMLLVSLRFSKETAQGLFAMGMIGFSIGAGFIASAIVSIVLSRRLGLWKEDSSEVVR